MAPLPSESVATAVSAGTAHEIVQPVPPAAISSSRAGAKAEAELLPTWEMALVLELAEANVPPSEPKESLAENVEAADAGRLAQRRRCLAPCLQIAMALSAASLLCLGAVLLGAGISARVSEYRTILPGPVSVGLIVSGSLILIGCLPGFAGATCAVRQEGLLVSFLACCLLLAVLMVSIAALTWTNSTWVDDAADDLRIVQEGCVGSEIARCLSTDCDATAERECLRAAAEVLFDSRNATDAADALCDCVDDVVSYLPRALDAAKVASLALALLLALASILTALLLRVVQRARPPRPAGAAASERRERANSEALLRRGLQLGEGAETAEAAATGVAAAVGADGDAMTRSDTKWLIEELRRRVEAAGLATQVLKLVPEGADPTAEADGEKEVDSGHNVTLLVVGCFDGGQRARRAAAATAAREGSSDAVSSLRFSGRLNRETASLIPTAV